MTADAVLEFFRALDGWSWLGIAAGAWYAFAACVIRWLIVPAAAEARGDPFCRRDPNFAAMTLTLFVLSPILLPPMLLLWFLLNGGPKRK